MTAKYVTVLFAAAALLSPVSAWARLGETEAQSQARYGEPAPHYSSPTDKPLMVGAKEVVYFFEGWRIRIALVNNVTVRVEYVHVPEGATPKPITDADVKVILDAEKGIYSWREQKPKTGNNDLNALKTYFEGRIWKRADHAMAKLVANLVLVLDSRDADTLEKRLAKQAAAQKPGKTPAGPPAPKF
jgi:hypothetical protein